MALTFGVTVLPDPPYTRLIELMQKAEDQGFEYGWTYDSHILWQDSYATLPLVASAQIAWPVETPAAVRMPLRRPPSRVFRIVRAVSCPGVTITTAETPRKAKRCVITGRFSQGLPPILVGTVPEGGCPEKRDAGRHRFEGQSPFGDSPWTGLG